MCTDRKKIYDTWRDMNRRCHGKHPKAKWYGGRGITVCEEWRAKFEPFFKWAITIGWKRGLQIDRIDNDGNYEPSNCRFVTREQNVRQSNLKRKLARVK
jgi:hypothetical protein